VTKAKPKRRARPQFSLRSFLLAVACGTALLAAYRVDARYLILLPLFFTIFLFLQRLLATDNE
jgi:hypothetical protein